MGEAIQARQKVRTKEDRGKHNTGKKTQNIKPKQKKKEVSTR